MTLEDFKQLETLEDSLDIIDVKKIIMLAEKEKLVLSDFHWEVIYFVQAFYKKYQYSPIQRLIVKDLQNRHPAFSSIDLHALFPEGPQQICRIAGLPKPARCV